MTTYTAITAAQTDADSYIDTALVDALKNNVLAIREQDASAAAVYVKGSWIEIGDSGAISGTPTEVDFTGIDSTYDVLMINFENVSPTSDDVDIQLRVQTGGSTWQTGSVYYYVTLLQTIINISANGVGNAANEALSGTTMVYNPAAAEYTRFINRNSHTLPAGTSEQATNTVGRYNATTAVTGIRLLLESGGTFASGRIKLYGLMK